VNVAELRNRIAHLPDDQPVAIWDDASGRSGSAEYATDVDGQLTICGKLQ
jgi:hypothetical protein